jgi:hypothetical protein
VDIDRVFVDLRRLAPHAVEQLRAREHPARLLQEIFEQPELGRAEVDVANAPPHPPRLPVKIEIARTETLGDPLGRLRRKSARTRAISSGTEKGLTT